MAPHVIAYPHADLAKEDWLHQVVVRRWVFHPTKNATLSVTSTSFVTGPLLQGEADIGLNEGWYADRSNPKFV
jgi:hypothetical protein